VSEIKVVGGKRRYFSGILKNKSHKYCLEGLMGLMGISLTYKPSYFMFGLKDTY
jgi:hypothetical protein